MIWDGGDDGVQQGQEERATARNVDRVARQRHRLLIYRLGVARMREKRAAGVPAIHAAWRVACDLGESFTLDTRDAGLLVGSLVHAAREE